MSKKNLKKALIPSLIALALCFAMLLGTTFAWFTDTAATGTNVIQSGNLDIALYAKTSADAEYAEVTTNTALLPNTILWEPGYMAVIWAKIENVGNLAAKYTNTIVTTGTVGDLADVIDVYYAPTEVENVTRDLTGLTKLGTLAEVLEGGEDYAINDYVLAGETDFATIVLVMKTTAGNEYKNQSIGDGFSIQVVATQYTYEKDSIDDQYDADAE